MIGKLLFPLLMLALLAKVSSLGFQQNSTATCTSKLECNKFHSSGCDAKFLKKHWSTGKDLTASEKEHIAKDMSCRRNTDTTINDPSTTNTVMFTKTGQAVSWLKIKNTEKCGSETPEDIWQCRDVPFKPTSYDACMNNMNILLDSCKSCDKVKPTEKNYRFDVAKNNGHFYGNMVQRQKPDQTWETFDVIKCNP